MDEWINEDGREYGVKHYHGHDIYYNYYCEDEYTVNFDGHDWWYASLEAAIKAIDGEGNGVTNKISNRKEVTKMLTDAIECHVNPNNDTRIYTAKEVTFDYATGHSVRVDFMRFKPLNNSVSGIEKGDFYCYEIKSSVEDFHSKNGHNFIGDYNYYVMPEDVYEKVSKEIPWGVGVFTSSMKERKGFVDLTQVKNAKRRDREKPVSEMLLMMFRSAARDLYKR